MSIKRNLNPEPVAVDRPVGEIIWLEYFQTTERGEQFLFHDSRASEPDLPVIFLFLSSSGLRLLHENLRWSIDGTFFCAPPQFVQLYTVNVFMDQTTMPCVFALLSDKSTETYSRMFSVLKNLGLEPQSVMADYEMSAINALDEVFEDFEIDLCLFHLSKNAFANVQTKHLHAAYENEEARVLLRCLPALAFLPVVDVARGFDEVKCSLTRLPLFQELNLERHLKEYLKYFEKTYIRRRVRGLPTEGLFPIASWNCYAAALKKLPRTNNHMEGWHQGFNSRFRKAHMSLSQFIIRLKAEEEKTRQMAVRFRVFPAETFRQPRRLEYQKRELNLKLLVERYEPLQNMEFLKAVQHHLAKFPVICQNEPAEESDEEEGDLI